jgi:ribosomal protein L10
MLVFQHNNLKAKEWAPLRRELNLALQKVDDELAKTNPAAIPLADTIKLQVVETGIFVAALKITEFFDPSAIPADAPKHILSQAAHEAVANRRLKNELAPLLSGPIALLTMPVVSPQHLKAALTILSPSQPNFPAPTRKANPGWHDLPVQAGLQKLMLMGARVEGKVFDIDGTKWVGTIAGGLDGLRAQLVHLLQSIGGGITNTLEAAGKSIYFTVEGRRMQLEEEQSPKKDGEATEEAKAQ